MKKISAHSKTSLFLMEMIFVLLFLALSSAACIRIFAAAKKQSYTGSGMASYTNAHNFRR